MHKAYVDLARLVGSVLAERWHRQSAAEKAVDIKVRNRRDGTRTHLQSPKKSQCGQPD